MRLLRPEFVPSIVLLVAVAQMATMADRGDFELSFQVAGLASLVSLASGLAVFVYFRNRDVTAARIAFSTGVLFFILLFGAGEYIFATYFPA